MIKKYNRITVTMITLNTIYLNCLINILFSALMDVCKKFLKFLKVFITESNCLQSHQNSISDWTLQYPKLMLLMEIPHWKKSRGVDYVHRTGSLWTKAMLNPPMRYELAFHWQSWLIFPEKIWIKVYPKFDAVVAKLRLDRSKSCISRFREFWAGKCEFEKEEMKDLCQFLENGFLKSTNLVFSSTRCPPSSFRSVS